MQYRHHRIIPRQGATEILNKGVLTALEQLHPAQIFLAHFAYLELGRRSLSSLTNEQQADSPSHCPFGPIPHTYSVFVTYLYAQDVLLNLFRRTQ